jgi:DNA-binding GntR family transcriptional regulator
MQENMKMKKRKSRSEEIAGELREWMLSQSLAPGDRLPSVRQLAKLYGAGSATIIQALSLLVEEKTICCISTKGGYEKASPEERSAGSRLPPKRPGPVLIAAQIQNDITEGFFDESRRLPSMAYLCNRYGSSTKTMRRALRILVSNGALIEKAHSRYGMPSREFANSASRVVIVSELGFASVTSYQTRRLIENLEQAAPKEWPSPVFLKASNIYRYAESHPLSGLILLAGKRHKWIAPIEKRFRNVPLAIIDLTDIYKIRYKSFRYRAVFSINNYLSACKLGRHLSERGFRKAAFISYADPASDTVCRMRFEGVSAMIGARVFVASDCKRIVEADKTTSHQALSAAVFDTIAACKELSLSLFQVYRPLFDGFFDFSRIVRRNEKLGPFFESVMQDEDCKVWVCADDELALAACVYLRAKNIAMPSQRALACFGDSFDLFVNGITTVNLGFGPIAHKVAHWLSSPSLVPRGRDGRVAVAGNVIVRSTT